jgi:hypothetical protein
MMETKQLAGLAAEVQGMYMSKINTFVSSIEGSLDTLVHLEELGELEKQHSTVPDTSDLEFAIDIFKGVDEDLTSIQEWVTRTKKAVSIIKGKLGSKKE